MASTEGLCASFFAFFFKVNCPLTQPSREKPQKGENEEITQSPARMWAQNPVTLPRVAAESAQLLNKM